MTLASPARHRRAATALIAGSVLASIAFVGGFCAFLLSLDRLERRPAASADAIVALTGGQGRVEDALDLLAAGYGRRLLITGVNERTSREAIARLSPAQRDLLLCCVDLDYRARNTVGNAAEIARWAREHRFSSVIVVTSNYHLPRALAELRHVMPDVARVPHAVVSRADEDWEAHLARARVVFGEYVKFLTVSVRNRLARGFSTGGTADGTRTTSLDVAGRRMAG